MGNNLYSNLVNFYNVNDENFKEFMAEIYKEMLTTHRDVQYVKEHITEEIEKILEKYLVDGEFNINIEEKVNEFLENNQEIKDITAKLIINTNKIEDVNTKLNINTSNIENINSQLDTIRTNLDLKEINVLFPPSGLEPLIPNDEKMETAIVNTERFKKIITYFGNNLTQVRIPKGSYALLNNISIPTNFSFVGDTIENETKLLDVSDNNDKNPFFTFKHPDSEAGVSNQNKIWGGHLHNITFEGKGQQHDGIVMYKTGWDSRINNVRVNNFGGSGIKFMTAFDTVINALTINQCGGIIDTIPHYALSFENGETDVCNAFHIFGLHIENSRYMLKLDYARHIYFVSSKFEQGGLNYATNDGINSPIYITSNCFEVSFDSSTFTPICFDTWKDKIGDSFVPPYFINIEKTKHSNDGIVKFIGCDYTPNNGKKGAKVIKSLSPTFINNCQFNGIYGDYGVYIDNVNSKVTNNSLFSFATEEGYNKTMYLKDCICNNNTLTALGDNAGDKIGVRVTGTSICENNVFYNFTIPYQGDDNYGNLNRCKTIVDRKGCIFLNDDNLSSMMDSNRNILLDLEKLPRASTYLFRLSSDAKIVGIKGGFGSEEITFVNNKINNITFESTNNTEGYKFMVNKPNKSDPATYVMTANKSITFKFIGYMWKEVSRSAYEV